MRKETERHGLIIVDMQNDFVLPGSPIRVVGAYDTIPKIRDILDLFRNMKWPVFQVVREYRPDGSDIEITRLQKFLEQESYVVPGTKGAEIVDELRPVDGEYRIVKNRFSAFMNTELDFMLRRLGLDHIAVCGTQYPVCVRTTIFDGVSYGYHVTLLTDAASAQTPEIAETNIRDIADIGVQCLTVAEFTARIKS